MPNEKDKSEEKICNMKARPEKIIQNTTQRNGKVEILKGSLKDVKHKLRSNMNHRNIY